MTALRVAFESQSRGCAKLGSPFMARLMQLLADRLEPGDPVSDRLLNWTGDVSSRSQSVPLRLAGALHALKRAGHPGLTPVYPPNTVDDDALWRGVRGTFKTDTAFLLDRLDSPPQTNEVRRAAALIPAIHMLCAWFPHPIHISEIGCSAGLNLRADQFRLTAGDTEYGPADSPVHLSPDWSGPAPEPQDVTVTRRAGVDLTPLDPQADRERLLSYLWPDQLDRIARTEAAITLAARHPADIARADAVDWLAETFGPREGVLHILFHTIAWQYLPAPSQAIGNKTINTAASHATATAPMARLSLEAAGPHADIDLQIWPGGHTLKVGRADYHGRWVQWDHARLPEEFR